MTRDVRLSVRMLLFVALAIAARAVTFGNPIVHVDEEFYYTVARAMTRGAVLYIDIWDRKPIGLFLLYLPAGLFAPPVGIYVYQGMALAAVVATALVAARIADRAGWQRGATYAGALYIVFLDLADGQGGQAPVFYNLLVACAALALVGSNRLSQGEARRQATKAMALVGLALQVKYTVVFEGVAFGIWSLVQDWPRKRSISSTFSYAALLCAVALFPTLIVATAYLAAGYWQQFFFANFASIFIRHPDPPQTSLANLWICLIILMPLLLLSILGAVRSEPKRDGSDARWFLGTWLTASFAGFLIFGSWFNHYTLPVVLPEAICTAAFIGNRKTGRVVGIVLIVAVFSAGQFILQRERQTRGTPKEFDAIVKAIGTEPGSLYVYQGSSMLYPATGRRALTPYVLASHLMSLREQGAVGVIQAREIARICALHPDHVVLQSAEADEDLGKRALALHCIAQGRYRRYAHLLLGNKTFDIFRQRWFKK